MQRAITIKSEAKNEHYQSEGFVCVCNQAEMQLSQPCSFHRWTTGVFELKFILGKKVKAASSWSKLSENVICMSEPCNWLETAKYMLYVILQNWKGHRSQQKSTKPFHLQSQDGEFPVYFTWYKLYQSKVLFTWLICIPMTCCSIFSSDFQKTCFWSFTSIGFYQKFAYPVKLWWIQPVVFRD